METEDTGGAQPTGTGTGTGTSNELSGTVLGPSVQAGSIHGDIHFHQPPASSATIPRQLMAPPAHFVGRERELSKLDRIFDGPRSTLVVVNGPGGVGKTALVMRWANRALDRFPDGQLYIDLGGFGGGQPVDPSEALGRFLRALGIASRNVPVTLAEQAALYRSTTANRSLLVLLDNAYSSAQVRALLPAPPAGALVTSRTRLVGLVPDGAQLLDLGPLPAEASIKLLARTVGADRIGREHEQAASLAQSCGGLPIALSVVAARLAARPALSVRRLASELAEESQRLRHLSAPDGPSVQATFDLSYRSLDPTAATLYRRLALHPGREFTLGPVSAVLAAIGTEPPPPPIRPVELLLAASLLEEVAEERFRFHDLVRLHAQDRADSDESAASRSDALHAMLEWYLAAATRADLTITPYRRRIPYDFATMPRHLPQFTDRNEALSWLERERINLIGAGRAAPGSGGPALTWALSDVLWPLFLYRKHYRDRLEVDRRGVEAARAWGNVWAEADMLKRLGQVCLTTGDHVSAEDHTRLAIRRFQEAGDPRGSADAEESLAALYRDTGQHEQAAELFATVLAINRRLGEQRSLGLTLINLGALLTDLGRPSEALRHLDEAREVFAELSAVDPYNGVRVLIALAGARLGTGDLAGAERDATDAAGRMRDLGSEYEHAEALDLLGRIAERRSDAGTAHSYYLRCRTIFGELDSARARVLDRKLAALAGSGPEARARDAVPASDTDSVRRAV